MGWCRIKVGEAVVKRQLPEDCPVCRGSYSDLGKGDLYFVIICKRCGDFAVHDDVWDPGMLPLQSKVAQAALAHALRRREDFPPLPDAPRKPFVTPDALKAFLKSGAQLPLPTQQVRNLISHIGTRSRETGASVVIRSNDYTVIGTAGSKAMFALLDEIGRRGLVRASTTIDEAEVQLTLTGWEAWEGLASTSSRADYGVIVMPFGNPTLTAFVDNAVRPAAAEVGYKLHRIDDPVIAKAGVIDNIMRQTIRDAAFVVADLTHGNNGAYWEAGFAEGLGKPVIYLCEAATWSTTKTHFDTNHCTTVIWDLADLSQFHRSFVATLRNSLATAR